MHKTLNLTPSHDDLNLVLAALGQLPYYQVTRLIGQLQSEAASQLMATQQPVTAGDSDQAIAQTRTKTSGLKSVNQ